jgi:hypothetical protein
MRVLVAGGTGFVGRYLIPALKQSGHQVVVLGRSVEKIQACFGRDMPALTWLQLNQASPDEFDAVINLTGENIGEKRWNDKRRELILKSRVEATTILVDFCLRAEKTPPHLYNTSAIGIYGVHRETSQVLAEQDALKTPQDFLSRVALAWEAAAARGERAGLKVTIMRFGVVLKSGEGMLKPLLPAFKLGLGSVLGDGSQFLSWISIHDLVRAILFLLEHPNLCGPFNLCAPEAVTQRQFAQSLARYLNRPLFLRLPRWFLLAAFGQMGEELLLGSQRVCPARLLAMNFQFVTPGLTLTTWKLLF